MKRSLFITAILFTITVSTMAQGTMKQRNNGGRILVAYFSVTGATAEVAEKIAKLSNGELYVIAPANP